MASSVAATSFWSGTLAPSTATASGTPRPSISVERLTPSLPRSVGFFPVFFPTQRRLGHRPVHALPFPVDAFQLVVFGQSELPEFLEHAQLAPTLESRRESRCRSRTAWASPSTGSLWPRHTRCHPRRSASATAGGRLYNCDCKLGSRDRSVPTKPRESGETLTPNRRPSTHLRAVWGSIPHHNARCVPSKTVFG